MKKIFIAAVFIFAGFAAETFAQTSTIEKMINSQQKTGNLLAGLLGANDLPSNNTEFTDLSAINFPNTVKVSYLDETRKLGKIRKNAVDKWLKNYNKTPADKKFYVNETLVEENGETYWIIVKESVLETLKSKRKNDSIILKMKILGSYRKGATVDYFLLAAGLE